MRRRTGLGPFEGAPWTVLDEAPLPQPLTTDSVAIRAGVVYSSRPGFRPLELDLYAPAGHWSEGAEPDRLPLVVWVHGGAFAMGSRRLLPDFLADADFFGLLAREGFVVASLDYRMSAEARWPAPVLDVREALDWLRERAPELGIDLAAVAMWGESAGAHLATFVGLVGDRPFPGDEPGVEVPAVAAIIDWYGPTNFAAMDSHAPADSAMAHDDADSPESRLLGAPVQEVPALVADADPANRVTTDAPPILIRHGRADRLVPFGQSELLAEALTRAGAPVTFLPVDGAGHVFEGHPDPRVFLDEAIEFLHTVLPSSASARIASAGSGTRG